MTTTIQGTSLGWNIDYEKRLLFTFYRKLVRDVERVATIHKGRGICITCVPSYSWGLSSHILSPTS